MKAALVSFFLGLAAVCLAVSPAAAQETVAFGPPQISTNREALLTLSSPLRETVRIETSTNLADWTGLTTFVTGPSNPSVDSGAPFLPHRFYRARVADTNSLTGDHLSTADGELTFHPINHATFVLGWKDKVIYFDPVGGAARFQGLPRADLILVTHVHSDHFDNPTIAAVKGTNAVILAPAAVYQALTPSLKSIAGVLTNGSTTNLLGLDIQALPAYNLSSGYHPKGTGNGYLLTLGGKRVYVSGDTEDIPELRALTQIDVAFVCMNLPFTMSVEKAASAVRDFQPRVAYVYHYSGYSSADVNRFKQLVGTDLGIEVRLRKWE
jgi:L-ascorbate metabolism protein UlaG (beta-lactamase superfamily)